MLINTAALIGDTKADVARAKSQFKLTESYLGAMRDTDRPLYIMQAFTRDYMATYGPILDVRFRQRGSAKLTTQQHSWLRAQYILRDMEVKEVRDWLRETQVILLSTIVWSTLPREVDVDHITTKHLGHAPVDILERSQVLL